MLLRRITKHVTDQNWFAVFVDFLIVVLGILIAFQITEWNEARENAKLTASYQERLKEDISLRTQRLEGIKDYYQIVHKHAVAAAEAFDKAPEELDEQFLIDLYQASQVLFGDEASGIYEELLSTGRIALIGNEQQRELLGSYYSSMQNAMVTVRQLSEYRPFIRKEIDFRVQQAIRDKCGDYVDDDESMLRSLVKLPEQCSVVIPIDLAQSNIAQLHTNKEVLRLLRFQIDVLSYRLFALDLMIKNSNTTYKSFMQSLK